MNRVLSYDRASVERALVIHYGERGIHTWLRQGTGYCVSTGIGLVTMRTLRETYVHVVGLAEGKRQAERAKEAV